MSDSEKTLFFFVYMTWLACQIAVLFIMPRSVISLNLQQGGVNIP